MASLKIIASPSALASWASPSNSARAPGTSSKLKERYGSLIGFGLFLDFRILYLSLDQLGRISLGKRQSLGPDVSNVRRIIGRLKHESSPLLQLGLVHQEPEQLRLGQGSLRICRRVL